MPNFDEAIVRGFEVDRLMGVVRTRRAAACDNLDRALRLHVQSLRYHDRAKDQLNLLLDLGYEPAFLKDFIKLTKKPVLGRRIKAIHEVWRAMKHKDLQLVLDQLDIYGDLPDGVEKTLQAIAYIQREES